MIDIDDPAVHGKGQTRLAFLVALTVQWQEPEVAVLRVLKERTTQCGERRCLVVFPPKSSQDPVKARQSHRRAEAGTRGALGQGTRETRLPYTARDLQPVGRFEGVLHV